MGYGNISTYVQGKEFIPSVSNNLVKSLSMIMQSLIVQKPGVNMSLPLEQIKETLSHIFVFSYIWAMGGNLVEAIREPFDSFARDLFNDFVRIPGDQSTPSPFMRIS